MVLSSIAELKYSGIRLDLSRMIKVVYIENVPVKHKSAKRSAKKESRQPFDLGRQYLIQHGKRDDMVNSVPNLRGIKGFNNHRRDFSNCGESATHMPGYLTLFRSI